MNDNKLHGKIPSLEGMKCLQVRARDGSGTPKKTKAML